MIHSVKNRDVFKIITVLKRKDFKENDIAIIEDTKEVLTYHNGEWVDKKNSEGAKVSLYDVNAQIINNLNPHNKDYKAIDKDIKLINDTFHDGKQYMLLNHNIRYFTLFQNLPNEQNEFSSLGDAVMGCAKEIGEILSVDANEFGAIELWIKITNLENPECFVLFNYDNGGVPYGR